MATEREIILWVGNAFAWGGLVGLRLGRLRERYGPLRGLSWWRLERANRREDTQ